MTIKITKGCMVEAWSGRTDLPEVKLKKGDIFEVEGEDEYDDENYSHVGEDGFPNLIIPKKNCVVID
jgi:hypothetical protein